MQFSSALRRKLLALVFQVCASSLAGLTVLFLSWGTTIVGNKVLVRDCKFASLYADVFFSIKQLLSINHMQSEPTFNRDLQI